MPNNESNIIIYTTPDGKASVALYTRDGKVWLNQKQIAELFGTSVPTVNAHISKILKEGVWSLDFCWSCGAAPGRPNFQMRWQA